MLNIGSALKLKLCSHITSYDQLLVGNISHETHQGVQSQGWIMLKDTIWNEAIYM